MDIKSDEITMESLKSMGFKPFNGLEYTLENGFFVVTSEFTNRMGNPYWRLKNNNGPLTFPQVLVPKTNAQLKLLMDFVDSLDLLIPSDDD